MNNEKFIISINVLQTIVNYLDTKPHREVRPILDAINNDIVKFEEKEEKKEVKNANN